MSKGRDRGEGSVYQTKDGAWRAAITLDDGKRRYFRGATRAEVAVKLTKALSNKQEGLPLPPGKETLGHFLTTWLEESAKPSIRPKTYQSYSQLVRVHIAAHRISKRALVKLQPVDVQSFLNEKQAQGLSPRTVQYLHAIIRRALEIALRWGLVGRNVAKLVDVPTVRRPKIVPFTPEQAKHFLETAKGDRLYGLYVVALATGLREGELFGLRWQDVDLDASTLRVAVQMQRIGGTKAFTEPKSERSHRTMHLPAFAVTALREHKVRQLEERLQMGERWQDWGLVFTTTVGSPLECSNLLKGFKTILGEAGLPPMRFHDLRHSAASLLLAQGVELRTIMELLGHSQISLTADTYTHLLPALKRQAADAMQRVFGE